MSSGAETKERYVYDRVRGDVIDSLTGVVVEERVPDPSEDVDVITSSHPSSTAWGWGLGGYRYSRREVIRIIRPKSEYEVSAIMKAIPRDRRFINVVGSFHRALNVLGVMEDWRMRIIEAAVHYFREIESNSEVRGCLRENAAAAFLLAVNDFRFPILPSEKEEIIEQVFNTKESRVRKTIKKIALTTGRRYVTPPPSAYVRRLCSEVKAPPDRCVEAEKKADEMRRHRRGTDPACIAAAAIHHVMNTKESLNLKKAVCGNARI